MGATSNCFIDRAMISKSWLPCYIISRFWMVTHFFVFTQPLWVFLLDSTGGLNKIFQSLIFFQKGQKKTSFTNQSKTPFFQKKKVPWLVWKIFKKCCSSRPVVSAVDCMWGRWGHQHPPSPETATNPSMAPGRWSLPWFISVSRGWRTHRFQLAQPGSLSPKVKQVNPLGNRHRDGGDFERACGLGFEDHGRWKFTFSILQICNPLVWNITIFNRKIIFIPGPFSSLLC